MDLFCFASRSEENIWLGVRNRLWAVGTVSDQAMRARITKARNYLRVGSRGILYCNPTQSFTTPFIVESMADPVATVKDIWPEPWVLPFRINPLGNPSRQLHKDRATELWQVLINSPHRKNVPAAMNITGTTVFVPVEVPDGDWALILRDLAVPAAGPLSDTPTPFFPEEVPPSAGIVEGALSVVTVNVYERDPDTRRRCIAAHGTDCSVCRFSFGARYGLVAEGYIHVHHLRPLSEVGGIHLIDPVADLRPVCPNCHAVLHRRLPAYSIEEVRAMLR